MLFRPCPKGTFTARLKISHVDFISGFWTLFDSHICLQHLKYLIENTITVGLFLDGDSSQPVSWAVLSNHGHINHLYTLEEHRRKGYGRVTILYLMRQMLEAGMTPVLEVVAHNTPSIKLNTGIGFVESFDATWIMYS